MARELHDAFDQTDSDDDVRVILLTGAGRGFCAGADLVAGASSFDPTARQQQGEPLALSVGCPGIAAATPHCGSRPLASPSLRPSTGLPLASEPR
ncbi:enoyl-CoA hydratase/isomerase family protein [Streptomyces sp. CA-100214]